MDNFKLKTGLISIISSLALTSCAVPKFDVPGGEYGPTIKTIYERIVCELVEMVKKDISGEESISIERSSWLATM